MAGRDSAVARSSMTRRKRHIFLESSFALEELTAAEEARLSALVKKAVILNN
jgi:hypothetical protein